MRIITTDNIKSILLSGENNIIEFKAHAKGAIHTLPQIISGFANTNGGAIIIGYDDSYKIVNNCSTDELEMVKNSIIYNKLAPFCDVYNIRFDNKTLIVVQVKKADSIVIVGSGAYVRTGTCTSVLSSKDVIERIKCSSDEDKTLSSLNRTIERLENKTEQIYDQMLLSQKNNEKEMLKQKKEHEYEKK